MASREERRRHFILTNQRYATAEAASADIGFPVLLPAFTAGHELQYLVNTRDREERYGVFAAEYGEDALEIAEWQGTSILDPGGLYSANSLISGLPASVVETLTGGRADQKVMTADLAWVDGEVNYHLWYEGSVEEARRIAESIPRR